MINRFSFSMTVLCFLACGVFLAPAVMAQRQGEKSMSMTLKSTAFGHGEAIGKRYTSDGEDISPPLTWQNAPAETREFALICDDPDAPRPEPWVHWIVYGISAETNELPEKLPPEPRVSNPLKLVQGRNSWPSGRTIGYRGPAPPPGSGKHHYHFKLYALDAKLDAQPGLDKPGLLKAMTGHILAETELVGVYSR